MGRRPRPPRARGARAGGAARVLRAERPPGGRLRGSVGGRRAAARSFRARGVAHGGSDLGRHRARAVRGSQPPRLPRDLRHRRPDRRRRAAARRRHRRHARRREPHAEGRAARPRPDRGSARARPPGRRRARRGADRRDGHRHRQHHPPGRRRGRAPGGDGGQGRGDPRRRAPRHRPRACNARRRRRPQLPAHVPEQRRGALHRRHPRRPGARPHRRRCVLARRPGLGARVPAPRGARPAAGSPDRRPLRHHHRPLHAGRHADARVPPGLAARRRDVAAQARPGCRRRDQHRPGRPLVPARGHRTHHARDRRRAAIRRRRRPAPARRLPALPGPGRPGRGLRERRRLGVREGLLR